MKESDRAAYIQMGKEFYSGPAVLHNIPEKYFEDTFDELIASDRYLEGYIFEIDGQTAGYSMVTKTFATEAGGLTLWLDELYVRPEFQGKGLGSQFIRQLKSRTDAKRIRLETEAENFGAQRLYKRYGFEPLEYIQYFLDTEKKKEDD